MPEHKISFDLPKQELSNVDANFYIHQDGKKLGQITISRGGIDYYPKHRKTNAIKLSWTRFDEIMKEQE